MRSGLGVRGTPVVPAQLEAEAGGSSAVRVGAGLSPTAGQPERAAETQRPVLKTPRGGGESFPPSFVTAN